MQQFQNIVVWLIVAAAVVYVLRAVLVALGITRSKAAGSCGGCSTCSDKNTSAVVQISLDAAEPDRQEPRPPELVQK
jgi:hypothetical protein